MPQLVNMYGITETLRAYRPAIAADAFEPRSLIGAPIPDLRIYLLDTKQRPVPSGVVGEMYIGGAGVARGVWISRAPRRTLSPIRFAQEGV